MESYTVYSFMSNFFHVAWFFQYFHVTGSSNVFSLMLLSSIPQNRHAVICLAILQLIDIGLFSITIGYYE